MNNNYSQHSERLAQSLVYNESSISKKQTILYLYIILLEEGSVTKVSKIEAHEAYQILLKILRAKNKFLAKRIKKPEQSAEN